MPKGRGFHRAVLMKIKHTTLDYEGDPVTIEEGHIYEAEPPYRDQVWNSEDLEWQDPEYLEDQFGSESLDELEMRCYYWDKL